MFQKTPPQTAFRLRRAPRGTDRTDEYADLSRRRREELQREVRESAWRLQATQMLGLLR